MSLRLMLLYRLRRTQATGCQSTVQRSDDLRPEAASYLQRYSAWRSCRCVHRVYFTLLWEACSNWSRRRHENCWRPSSRYICLLRRWVMSAFSCCGFLVRFVALLRLLFGTELYMAVQHLFVWISSAVILSFGIHRSIIFLCSFVFISGPSLFPCIASQKLNVLNDFQTGLGCLMLRVINNIVSLLLQLWIEWMSLFHTLAAVKIPE